ncbi:hypothetical protein Pla163_03550 [Planctomycetes bacterium Pla163]|uniref:YeeE/YedE family protein n=1 Tax=Rohdeia mirabilis TaxID=2528008 RepID=A0A518CVJ7_9BACT|nr:hypothetical protein Pla163_03550 [Planctomycetes bacterium Pla163]
MSKIWFTLLPGLLFGIGLAISGMTDPAKVVNFLDFAGTWDPSLAFVMGGGLATFALLRRVVLRRTAPVLGGSFPRSVDRTVDARLVIGSALFGAGWGLAGFCPGPAVANLASGHWEALVFVVAMLVGMRAAQLLFGLDRA